jgi:MFS family permease
MQLKRSTTPGSTTNHAQPSYDGRWTCAYFRSVHVSPIDYDLGFLPLTIRNPVMYLLNYLDRGNIGNSKLLNSETGDSLIQQTKMTNLEYAIAVSLFAVAYALFEVPSNWIMKRYVRPSRWLATLLLSWGIFTIGFAGVRNFAQVTILRFFIGVFEAGFFPGA